MYRKKVTAEEQVAALASQLSNGVVLMPDVMASEPQRGLVAVMEHVQRCTPGLTAATLSVKQTTDKAELVAEELEEVVTLLDEQSCAGLPAVEGMLSQLRKAGPTPGSSLRK